MWMSRTSGGILSPAQLESYLAGFEQKAAAAPAWPAFISSAFPRFRDIYQQAEVGPSYGYLDDRNGDTLRQTLGRALTNASALVQLVTWNDFGEGTILEPTADFGFRDLGILQDCRRQYVDADFPYHTNELALALRLFNLRRQAAGNRFLSAELDRVFANAVSGNPALADRQLTGIESSRPVIYDVSQFGGQMSFAIGGYLTAAGLQVQASSDWTGGSWQTVGSLPATTNQPSFIAAVPSDGACLFRVRNAAP
jgi:hypothetical protein